MIKHTWFLLFFFFWFWLWFNQCIRRFYCRCRFFSFLSKNYVFFCQTSKKTLNVLLTFECVFFWIGISIFSETKSIKTKTLNKRNDSNARETSKRKSFLKFNGLCFRSARARKRANADFYFSSISCWIVDFQSNAASHLLFFSN